MGASRDMIRAATVRERSKAMIRPTPRLRRAVTLAELIIALVITSLIALGVASILYAASYGTSSRREIRRIAVHSQQLRTRLDDAIRNARAVLACGQSVGGDKYLVLWKGDSSPSDRDQVNLSELLLIEWRSALNAVIGSEAASAPDPDSVCAAGSDFYTVATQARDNGDLSETPWSEDVTAFSVVLEPADPVQARTVTWEVTLTDELLSETLVSTASLRSQGPPK